ncbi:MAG: PolC-type DNA polymerase III [Oscillospiraceae bacterium]|nr:PolC-type DNA polymerase III [Oscillospiraceae bacterium]
MSASQCIPLSKLFSKCSLYGPQLELAQNCIVTHSTVDVRSRTISLKVRVAFSVEETELNELAEQIARAYGIDHLELELEESPAGQVLTREWLCDLMRTSYPPSIGLLNQAEMEDRGDEIVFSVMTGGSQALSTIAMELSQRVMEVFGRRVRISFRDRKPPSNDVLFQHTESIRSRAMQTLGGVAVSAPVETGGISAPPVAEKKTKTAAPSAPAAPPPSVVLKPVPATDPSVIFGKRNPEQAIPISELTLDLSVVTVEGTVFAVNHRELPKRKAWVISFDMTDNTNSVTVSQFMENEKAKPILDGIHEGMYVKVKGRVNLSRYTNDLELMPYSIQLAEQASREDRATDKRVELHMHTRFSTMDALTEPADIVKRAISWGHPAIAVTDHGVLQAFPDMVKAAKGKIKIIFGVEAYFINDKDDRVVVHGDLDQSLDEDIVCFDLETTGLNKKQDRITEIGAVVLRNGEICEEFSTFVNPGKPIPREVVELTGITDEMVADAPDEAAAVAQFLDWVGERPMAAHNAEFDTSFLAAACARMGRPFDCTYIDTLILSQNLLPDLNKFKLDIVAERLNLPAFNHHRATDDAATVGYMLIPFHKMLGEMGVHSLQGINPAMEPLRGKNKVRRKPKHLIVLAKNQTGLRNLYKLVSLSHLEHFKRVPIIPKSLLDENREGLIIGSACEAGELFQAIVAGKDMQELKRIASWYDFLEIQPLCNNQFMLRNGTVKTQEELRDFNRTVLALGRALDKPVCATGDVHFLDPEQEIYRHVLLASKKFSDADEPLPIYFKTTDEMLEEFSYLGAEDCRRVVIDDPQYIANQCDTIPCLPKGLFAPKLKDSAKELEYLVYTKAHELYGEELPQIVQDRIDLELPGIIQRKYDVIYMSAQKLVQNSLEHGYLVGSRGSVGSSIVAFLSGITEVNSLPAHYRCPKCKHADFSHKDEYGCGVDMPDAWCPVCGTKYVKDGFNIPFETFLGYGGTKVPDIDLNFSGEYQAKAHRYTFELFGESHVFRAGTIGTVAEKTAYGYVLKYLEERGRHCTHAEERRLAKGCVGVKRTTGQHPGGMVVIPGDKEIYDFCPVQHPADDPNTDIVTTHFEYHCMEDNLLKLDMLGHDDPTIIRHMENLTGVNAREIPLDDKETMSIFTKSRVLGYEDDPFLGPTGAVAIPEFNTRFTRGMLMDTNPEQFNTLIRLSGFSHGTDVWLGNARDLITSKTATVDSTVGCRDDIMLYLISVGCDPLKSFQVMEAVRKGKVKKNGFSDGWVEMMKEHDVPDWYIDSLAKIGYLFPKAHAAAYVMMAFRIAWFKVHRPLAFYSAFFSIRAKAFDATCMCLGMEVCQDKIDEINAKEKPAAVEEDMMVTLEVCYEYYLRGFTFDKMDIYRSDAVNFLLDEERNALIPPFAALPGLGENAAQQICELREGHSFVSVEEFANTCKVSQASLELLRHMGALDGMPETSQVTLF